MTAAAFSAPGKLMLFGEFAVLQGHPSLAMCFDRRLRCEARDGGGVLRFDAPELLDDEVIELPLSELAAQAPRPELRLLWPLLREAAPRLGGLSLRFDAEFPPTWGLGSSSASSVAAVAAVRQLLGALPPLKGLFTEAHELQRSLQGRASGYDVATQLLGGTVMFQDARSRGELVKMRQLATHRMHWQVAYTGNKASTTKMISVVEGAHAPGQVIYDRIGGLAKEGITFIEHGNSFALGDAMNRGHALLGALGAVPAHLDDKVRHIQSRPGVLGARMCGAGGGDCVLLLVDEPRRGAAAVDDVGFELLSLNPTPHGLREEPVSTEVPRDS
ncbi:MAG: hypothetical protein KDA24_00675 [Deltaproteobacteria bacterium]|nr:hypothetical protein [Deltaproteobacteria bacterium]